MMTGCVRRARRLALDRRLLEDARALGVNVSRATAAGLLQALREARAQRWRDENAGAIADYNRFIDEDGVPLARHCKF